MSTELEQQALDRLCEVLNDKAVKKLIADRVFLTEKVSELMEERDQARAQRDRYKRDLIATRIFKDNHPKDLAQRVKNLEHANANLERELRNWLRQSSIDENEINEFVRKLNNG